MGGDLDKKSPADLKAFVAANKRDIPLGCCPHPEPEDPRWGSYCTNRSNGRHRFVKPVYYGKEQTIKSIMEAEARDATRKIRYLLDTTLFDNVTTGKTTGKRINNNDTRGRR